MASMGPRMFDFQIVNLLKVIHQVHMCMITHKLRAINMCHNSSIMATCVYRRTLHACMHSMLQLELGACFVNSKHRLWLTLLLCNSIELINLIGSGSSQVWYQLWHKCCMWSIHNLIACNMPISSDCLNCPVLVAAPVALL